MPMSGFASVSLVVLLVIQIKKVSGSCSPDLVHVPGCRILFGVEGSDSSKLIATCSGFNINSTPALLSNCTTKLQIYNSKNLPTDLPLVPQLSLLSILELTYNSMYNISRAMFEGLQKLKSINLKGNLIQNVPPDVFANNRNLEFVDLSANPLISLESVVFAVAKLKNLKSLRLSKNMLLRWINNNDFIPLENSSLEALDVSGCAIEYIESNAFQPLKFLTSLNISQNRLPEEGLTNLSQSLRKDNLKELSVYEMTNMPYFSCKFLRWLQSTRLESLDISINRFICFPKGSYPYLQTLNLYKCNIVHLSDDSFSGMPKLEYLVLKRHRLTSIGNEFKSNMLLKVLDLKNFAHKARHPSLTFEIADFSFENQKELVDLRLSDLPTIRNIRRYMLYGLIKLQSLTMLYNYISSIDCFAFETLSSLIFLDLDNNLISALSQCTFYGLRNVQVINLSNNRLTFIDEMHPFLYTPNLEVIRLNYNKIAKLPAYVFKNLQHLDIIILNGNIIQPWYHDFIPEKSNQTKLILDENAITHFTQKMFDDISRIQFVQFANNPINCSHCSIVKLQEWMRKNTLSIPSVNRTGDYTCHTPDSLRQADILTANITSVTLRCFPPETDFLTSVYIFLSLAICMALLSTVIWHRWSWNIKYCIFLLQLRTRKYKDLVDSKHFVFDAYVSYCESSLEWIENHLVPALENGNPKFRLCLPDRNFDAGCSILDNIISAIDRSRCTIIIVSNDYLDSRWCLYNVQMAQNILFEKTRSGLIIVLLEDIKNNKLVKDLQYVLRTRTCIWWTENPVGQKLFWERLCLAIRRPTDKGISTHIT